MARHATETKTLEKITETSTMMRTVNRGLMVRWINDDLVYRCGHDVDKSWVFYDQDMLFVFALTLELSDKGLEALAEKGTIAYYSKGIV